MVLYCEHQLLGVKYVSLYVYDFFSFNMFDNLGVKLRSLGCPAPASAGRAPLLLRPLSWSFPP